MADEPDEPSDERGITDEDLERIDAYLDLRPYERTPDALRPSSDD